MIGFLVLFPSLERISLCLMFTPLFMNTRLLLSLKTRYLKRYSFEVEKSQEIAKSLPQETIAGLKEANAMLRQQVDDLEQYTHRTNIQISEISETTDTDPEDTTPKAIDFSGNQLGITTKQWIQNIKRICNCSLNTKTDIQRVNCGREVHTRVNIWAVACLPAQIT